MYSYFIILYKIVCDHVHTYSIQVTQLVLGRALKVIIHNASENQSICSCDHLLECDTLQWPRTEL